MVRFLFMCFTVSVDTYAKSWKQNKGMDGGIKERSLIQTKGVRMEKKKILVVDDEEKILEVVTSLLEQKGYEVVKAFDGISALSLFEQEKISLILLDLMLPDMSGEEVCKKIRAKSRVPIIMLTAKVGEEDLLHGLHIGADDYMIKPFRLKELAARVEVVLRRASDDLQPLYKSNTFRNGELFIEIESNTVKKNGLRINLTQSEWKILVALMKYPNKVFTRDELIQIALKDCFDGYDRTIDSHIKNLRQKIEDNPRQPIYVITVHGKGYRFGGD